MNKTKYQLKWLDNGIVLAIPEYDTIMCKTFSNDGKPNDEEMIKFVGKFLWKDIRIAAEELLESNLKITIIIEKDKKI